MENVDPVGINAGDSIIVSPAQTLSDAEAVALRASAVNLTAHLRVNGVCNVRFALRQDGGEYAVLEANPSIRRASALAAKVTGYPIPYVCAQLILGRTLDQIKTSLTDFPAPSVSRQLTTALLKCQSGPLANSNPELISSALQ